MEGSNRSREIAALVQVEASRWEGREVEVTGLLKRRAGGGEGGVDAEAGYVVSFWALVGPESDVEHLQEGEPTTLEALCAAAGALDGRKVRVIGKFRGRNLYGDLQSGSRPWPGAWVIKDDRYAAWVTGKEPAGTGWALEPDALEATSAWLEWWPVPRTHGGVVSLRALRIQVIPPPAAARVLPPRLALVGNGAPPAVLFTLPLEGEPVSQGEPADHPVHPVHAGRDLPREGPPALRRAGLGRGAGDPHPDHLRRSAPGADRGAGASRSIRGGDLELLLLPGILDARGVPLAPRPGAGAAGADGADGAVDVVRYVAGS